MVDSVARVRARSSGSRGSPRSASGRVMEPSSGRPRNLLGTFDVYHTSRHGTDWAGSPALVHAVHPRIAIMNNGAMKGGTKGTFEIVRSAPGVRDR